MENGYVKSTFIKEGLLEIEFFHPKQNSLPGAILAELAQEITKAGENDDVKVILLKSGCDRTFCAGASFDELLAIEDVVTGKAFFMGFANVINAMRKVPKFILGRVQGKAVGGGIGVAASTDYCFATKFASIKLSELAVGIGPFVVTPAIERKMGLSAVSQMGINASEFHSVEFAQAKGLYHQVFDSVEEMDQAVMELADKLIVSNPESMAQMKKMFWQGTDHWDELLAERAQISGNLVTSDFTKSFISQFKSK